MKECIICKETKDNWSDFTRTDKDTPYEVDVCQSCRIKQLAGVI